MWLVLVVVVVVVELLVLTKMLEASVPALRPKCE